MRKFLILVSLLLWRGCLLTTEDYGCDLPTLVFGDQCPTEDGEISLTSGQDVNVKCILPEDRTDALVKMEMSCEYAGKRGTTEVGKEHIHLKVDMRMNGMRCSCVYFTEEMPLEEKGEEVTVTIKTSVCLSQPTISINGRESEANTTKLVTLEDAYETDIRCYTQACERILESLILTCDYEGGNRMVGKTEVSGTIRIDIIVQTCQCESFQRDGTVQKTTAYVASKSLTCATRKWMHFEDKKTDITVVEMDRSWKHAKSVCEHLGSHLYNILDIDKDNFLSLISDDENATYWFGDINHKVKAKTKRASAHITKFSNWVGSRKQEDKPNAKTCKLISPATGALSKANCRTPSHFICEGKEPCKHRPGLAVNGGMALGDRNISMVKQSDVKIECILLGDANTVSVMFLRCDRRMKRMLDTSAPEGGVLVIEADHTAHERNCSCTSVLKDGNKLQVNITFDITWPPTYADGFVIREMAKFPVAATTTIKLLLVSNPKPNEYWLEIDKKDVLKSMYRLDVGQDGSYPYDYTVTLSIPKRVAYPGRTYTLFVDNGVLNGFNYSFELTRRRYKAIFLNDNFMTNLLPLSFVFVCFSLICLVVWRRRRVKPVTTRAASRDESSSGSIDSTEASLALSSAYDALRGLPPGLEMSMLQYMQEVEVSKSNHKSRGSRQSKERPKRDETERNRFGSRERQNVTRQNERELEIENA